MAFGSLVLGVIIAASTSFNAATVRDRIDPCYGSCKEAHSDGAYDIKRGESGYSKKLDRDNDDIAYEG